MPKIRRTKIMMESINLKDIWELVKKSWMVLLAAAIIAALIAAVYSALFVPETYSSSVTLYVSNAANSTTGNVNANDLNASQLLANTSVQLLAKEPARAMICDTLKSKGYIDMTPGKLGAYVTITQTLETELLTVVANTEDANLSAEICNAYASIAPAYLQGIIEAGSFKAVDVAKPATSPSSPSLVKNAVIGAFIGAVLAFAVYLVLYMFDTSVKDADDIKKKFNLPVLGEIPTFSGNVKM